MLAVLVGLLFFVRCSLKSEWLCDRACLLRNHHGNSFLVFQTLLVLYFPPTYHRNTNRRIAPLDNNNNNNSNFRYTRDPRPSPASRVVVEVVVVVGNHHTIATLHYKSNRTSAWAAVTFLICSDIWESLYLSVAMQGPQFSVKYIMFYILVCI